MGTHPSAPARLAGTGTPLAEHLASHPNMIGAQVSARFAGAQAGAMPFLLKVLAIEKALSIQVHPDKAMAERLHAAQPNVYKGTYQNMSFGCCDCTLTKGACR